VEDLEKYRKQENVVNEFLSLIPPETSIIEFMHLEKIITTLSNADEKAFKVMENFIEPAKTDLIMNKHFFSFA
jgi:hypothetical protein